MSKVFPSDFTEKNVPIAGDFVLGYDSMGGSPAKFDLENLPISIPVQTAITNISLTPGPPGADGANGSISVAPAGAAQTVDDNSPKPTGATVTTDDVNYIQVTRSDGTYTKYTLTGIYEYDANGDVLTYQLVTGVFGTQELTYADILGVVDKTTGVFNYKGNPAYKNVNNIFTATNTFEGDVVFKGRISTPYNVIPSASGDFTFDNLDADYQGIIINGSGTQTCTFSNLTAGVKSFFVLQQGTAILDFDIDNTSGSIQNIYIFNDLNGNASYNPAVALPAGTYFFTMVVAEAAIHLMLTGKSVFYKKVP